MSGAGIRTKGVLAALPRKLNTQAITTAQDTTAH